ncbi:PadR family transcriptional regulator [Gordonia sp. CPCC 205515]|uniref:PadR family transcriptional regulator n=1 Tax=Gordonia sp. CPCC 205515 TaxID=3140791 RepID=UPI003AF34D13
MGATTTRLLLLGAVGIFEPVNGYQIRRELLSWQVDRWAHVNPGSIYHGLTRLATDGLLRRHDLPDGARDVAVYELTDVGRAELDRLIETAILTVDIFDRRDLHAAFGLLPIPGDARAAEWLTARHASLTEIVADFPAATDPATNPAVPPHALRSSELWAAEARAELEWLTTVLADLAAGRLRFTPSPEVWTPPSDDPGRQMVADRARYRTMIEEKAIHAEGQRRS